MQSLPHDPWDCRGPGLPLTAIEPIGSMSLVTDMEHLQVGVQALCFSMCSKGRRENLKIIHLAVKRRPDAF